MKSVRARLVALALAVLTMQLTLLVATPAALCRVGSASVADATTCTCIHADGIECPMHKGAKPSRSGQKPGPQFCTGCGEQAAAIMTALTTAVAILQPASRTAPPSVDGIALAALAMPIRDLDRRPSSPPPRG